jgi:hypothetical protein
VWLKFADMARFHFGFNLKDQGLSFNTTNIGKAAKQKQLLQNLMIPQGFFQLRTPKEDRYYPSTISIPSISLNILAQLQIYTTHHQHIYLVLTAADKARNTW